MTRLYFKSLVSGLMLTALPLQATATEYSYERIRDEDETGKRPSRQITGFKPDDEDKENSTKIVHSTLDPAFEQVILYFQKESINFNLASFIKELTPSLGNYPLFLEWTTSRYGIPTNLMPALYDAVMTATQLNPSHKSHSPSKSNPPSAIRILEEAAKAPTGKQQELRPKIDRIYSIALQKLDKQLLSENSIESDQENMDLSYKRAKLNYHYALTFSKDSSEQRAILLRKAQEDFNKIQQVKQDKVKSYRRLIAQYLYGSIPVSQ